MIPTLIWLSLSAFAAPQPYLGGHASGTLLSPNNELYQSGAEQQTKSLAAGFGILGGVNLSRYFGLEAEADAGDWPLAGGAALLGALRVHPKFVLPDLLGQGNNLLFTVGVGALMALSREELIGRDLDMAVHVGPGAEFALSDRLRLRTDARVLISARKGVSPAPATHALLTVGLSWHPWSGVVQVADTDGDGLPDDVDGCPSVAETVNGYNDDDGCADRLAELQFTVTDTAGDGVIGAEVWVGQHGPELTGTDGQVVFHDLTPAQSYTPRVVFAHGVATPSLLLAEEGLNQGTIGWRWNPGTVYVSAQGADGSPTDAELVAQAEGHKEQRWRLGPTGATYHTLPPGSWDLRAEADGLAVTSKALTIVPDDEALLRISFALRKAAVKVSADTFELQQQIQFATNSSEVRAVSSPVITEVAHLLAAHPEVTMLQVEGYTDNLGDADFNQRLSQARVDEVVRLLIEAGVSAERLSATGFGESRPIADNATPEGRAKNRRVVLRVMATDEAPK